MTHIPGQYGYYNIPMGPVGVTKVNIYNIPYHGAVVLIGSILDWSANEQHYAMEQAIQSDICYKFQ